MRSRSEFGCYTRPSTSPQPRTWAVRCLPWCPRWRTGSAPPRCGWTRQGERARRAVRVPSCSRLRLLVAYETGGASVVAVGRLQWVPAHRARVRCRVAWGFCARAAARVAFIPTTEGKRNKHTEGRTARMPPAQRPACHQAVHTDAYCPVTRHKQRTAAVRSRSARRCTYPSSCAHDNSQSFCAARAPGPCARALTPLPQSTCM